jgi:epoxyqueuosine reductase QueG
MLRFGSLLHMAAVVTDTALPGDPVKKEQPCPSDCSACHGICPSEAFDANGKFNQMTCVQYAVEHAIYPLALKNELGRKYIERVVNTAGHNYWLACNECLSFISCFRPFVLS